MSGPETTSDAVKDFARALMQPVGHVILPEPLCQVLAEYAVTTLKLKSVAAFKGLGSGTLACLETAWEDCPAAFYKALESWNEAVKALAEAGVKGRAVLFRESARPQPPRKDRHDSEGESGDEAGSEYSYRGGRTMAKMSAEAKADEERTGMSFGEISALRTTTARM